MKYDDNYEKNIMIFFIKLIAYIFKWLFLIFAVISTSLLVSFLIFTIFRSATIDTEGLSKMASFLTYYQESEIPSLIETVGKTNVMVGCFGYGAASSIVYILLYLITSKFIKLFKLISKNKMFSDEAIKLINSSMYLGVLVTLTQPVILLVINIQTGLFKYEDFNISGIIILFAIYILKLIIEEGNKLKHEKESIASELSKTSCLVSEMKIDKIKKDAKIKMKKKQNREKEKKTIKR